MATYLDYAEYRIAVQIWKIAPPILLILGTAGNLLTIMVLMQRKNRQSSTSLFLTALAVSDLLVLWTGMFRNWFVYLLDIDIRKLSKFGCKFHVFLVYGSFQCSSWFLVGVTMDRFIGVLFPHRVKVICTVRKAGVMVLLIISLLILLNLHWFYGYTIRYLSFNNVTGIYHCSSSKEIRYQNFLVSWRWIDLFVVSLIPITFLCIANIAIIARLAIRKHKTRVQIVPSTVLAVSTRDKRSQLTKMLIAVNIMFIVCSTPLSVVIIIQGKWLKSLETPHDMAVLSLWWAIVNMLAYLNSTLNFVLYFLSGSRFRQEVKDFFRRKWCLEGSYIPHNLRTRKSTRTRQINTISTGLRDDH